jgi:16S rRNA (cytosine1402-N4)-methyltransferase
MHHTPVLLGKVMEILEECACYGNVVDATLGLGGYAERILSSRKEVRLLGIDRDEEALQFAKERLASFGERFVAVQGNFRNLETLVCDQGFSPAKAILFDLGVSNFQLSEPRRGFSFQNEGPLDMRMGPDASLTAEAVLNTASCGELTRIFRDYGEERHAYLMAKLICAERERSGGLHTTTDVVEVLRRGLPAPMQRKMGGHPARKLFQALRIHVNDELGALNAALEQCSRIVSGGSVVVFVSYHSLEDRLVKQAFRKWETEGLGKRWNRKLLVADDEEIDANYKARSAKLRGFIFSA